MSDNESDMLRVGDVAEILGVSRPCVYALIRESKLACHRIGVGRGALRIRRADVNEYLQSCRVGPNKGQAHSPVPSRLKHIKLRRAE